jgi:hypothetical protein
VVVISPEREYVLDCVLITALFAFLFIAATVKFLKGTEAIPNVVNDTARLAPVHHHSHGFHWSGATHKAGTQEDTGVCEDNQPGNHGSSEHAYPEDAA